MAITIDEQISKIKDNPQEMNKIQSLSAKLLSDYINERFNDISMSEFCAQVGIKSPIVETY